MSVANIVEQVIAGLVIAGVVGGIGLLLSRFRPDATPSLLTPYPIGKLIVITGALLVAAAAVLDRTSLIVGGILVGMFGMVFIILDSHLR